MNWLSAALWECVSDMSSKPPIYSSGASREQIKVVVPENMVLTVSSPDGETKDLYPGEHYVPHHWLIVKKALLKPTEEINP